MEKHHKKKTKTKKKIWREQQELRQNMMKEEEEKEHRRTTRMTTIVAILALAGTILTFLYKMALKVLNVWVETGVIYQYLKMFISLILAIMIMILIDIVYYVLYDLKRHDVLNIDYRQYDKKSDERYKSLIFDVQIYVAILLISLMPIFFFSIIYGEKDEKWSGILAFMAFAACGIEFVRLKLKGKNKKTVGAIIRKIGWKLVGLGVTGIFCYYIGTIVIIDSNITTINIDYDKTGTVVINNVSSRNYENLEIEIYNEYDEKIYFESVEKEKLLFAGEDKNIKSVVNGETIGEALLLNDERLYWKYSLNLQKTIKQPGKYYIFITVYEDGKSVVLKNTCLKEKKEYIFARENMKKDY